MMDFIYTLFIAPLEYWMHVALDWGYSQTHTWGWAIVVMSLVVNLVILPIYMKAEAWQEQERAIRKSFEAKEAMIKAAFKGQERFAMISTMQRQAGFSPLLSMRSSIGFFLQIPFFFAAYHFLSHFEPLAGVSFMGLRDLSKPDAMLSIGGFAVNVMPVLMTVINLASALIYTHNLSRRDKIQLYGMAAVFLVLLYDAASGLVLYWTCNNIFSLGKNIVYDLCHRLNHRLSFSQYLLRKQDVQPYYAKTVRIRLRDGLLFYVWLFAAITAFVSSNQMTLLSEPSKLLISDISDIGFLLLAALCVIEAIRLRIWRGHLIVLLLSALILYYGVSVWYKWYFLGNNRHYFALIGGLLFLIPTLSLTALRMNLPALLYPRRGPEMLFTPAAYWIVILVTCYLPVQAYCTAPEIFSSTPTVLAKMLSYAAIGAVLFWCVGKLFILSGCQKLAGYLFGLLATLFTVYAFMLPLDVGTIDAFQISDTGPLFSATNIAVDCAVLFAVTTIFAAIVRSGHANWLRGLFVVCIVASLGNGMLSLWQSQGKWRTEDDAMVTALPEYNDRLLGFSKNEKNTVVVMLDAFTGSHVKQIVEEYPDILESYRGFTWYPDTLPSGNSTIASIPSIVCGLNCKPEALNAQPEDLLAEKINRHFAGLVNTLGPNIDASLYERNWLEPQRLRKYTELDPLLIRHLGDSYVNRYIQKNNLDAGRGDSDVFLLSVSLFNSVPWSLKNMIYKDGRWIETLVRDKSSTLVLRALRDWALFDSLPELSNAEAQKGTYKFIDTELTHNPWFMEPGSCKILKNPKRTTRADGIIDNHLVTEACSLQALGRWFDWMKKEGVFDNTRIILVSDHSSIDCPLLIKNLGDYRHQVGRVSALLLVKDFNAQHDFKTDWSSQSIANVGEMVIDSPKREDPTRRRITHAKPLLNEYAIPAEFEVRGSIFERDSWTRVK